ncbi:MAG TPA: chemotaxis protein CheB [Steroidobacteraceae bacterium]|jgi:two-component system chemotaxis response regulator CheB
MRSDALTPHIDGIVIGGSAGAIEALDSLLPTLPPRFPAAIFIVLHLPRDRPSMLTEIFAAKCVLPIEEAEDKAPVRPGTIYFAPPDYHLLIEQGRYLALSVDDPVNLSRPSADVLFESAADVYGPALMGVILSGASADGALGLAAVRAAGGLTVVQEPGSAAAPLMITSALERCAVDYVLPLEEIAALLRRIER